MKRLIKENLFYLVPYLGFACIAAACLLMYSKREIHLEINAHHSGFADVFFYIMTYVGDGVTGLVIGIFIFWWKGLRTGITTGLAMITAAAVTQTLKHTIFSGEPRPKVYFESIHEQLRFVPWVENYLFDSFPSGHSTQAFALCFCLAILLKNNWAKTGMFLLAVFIGFSRMYLSQHFLRDVFFGSLIGTVMTLLVFAISTRMNKGRLPFEK
ncbi:MAG: membrane-associated phospholipid phosphatase [Bacteroidetes bacterium]|nr:MAG: membrane-associated phospholipid phosphatase [Bacteroidota bacterium]